VLFLARGRILLQGEPGALIREHGAATLEDLFVSVAHEALAPEHP
jgi:ABC-2 type transport system ATP-binding protein